MLTSISGISWEEVEANRIMGRYGDIDVPFISNMSVRPATRRTKRTADSVRSEPAMDNDALVADLIEFVSCKPRTYKEVMDAWRTSCPRLAIWEDAVDNGLLARRGRMVVATEEGKRFVEHHRTACEEHDTDGISRTLG